ncbi:MAG: glycosyltransferase family 2 protein [Steroidobacteraceae bacterium]
MHSLPVVIVFWLAVAGLLHSYVVFPLLLRMLAARRQVRIAEPDVAQLPLLSVVMAAYNEERVIAAKLDSLFACGYPLDRLEVLVGSDSSTDDTDVIVATWAAHQSGLRLRRFGARTGKAGIINALIAEARGAVIVVTDANVMIGPGALQALADHFKDPRIGLVDSNMQNLGARRAGISTQEKSYIRAEVGTKLAEGRLWGAMTGPFGGCYAVRRELFRPVPANFLVDDFYVNMCVLEQGHACISEPRALVYEDVSNDVGEEFRRKTRIATGNFQNLLRFRHLLLRGHGVGFCFFSHKVLRWFGPLLILVALLSSGWLLAAPATPWTWLYGLAFAGLMFCLLLLPLDRLLNAVNVHLGVLRFNTHFFFMNAALLLGLLRFLRGVDSGVWQPTRRNQ